MMNFIDIASWQAGLNLESLFAQNNLDGVIVKLTQGTGYINPEAKSWLNWLRSNDKPFGTYHYLDGSGAISEARHYANQVKEYPGGVMVLDYEDSVLNQGTGYLKTCLDEVYRLIGVRPLIYCSLSVIQSQDFSAIAFSGYQLWIAQYADMNIVNGFLEHPWRSGSVAPFTDYVMHQYTACGRLRGWNSNLDFDRFKGDLTEWNRLAGIIQSSPTPTPEPSPQPGVLKGPDPNVIMDILNGKYGIGIERSNGLRNAGYNPELVQNKINELYEIAVSCSKHLKGNEDYCDSICYIVKAI